MPQRKGMEQKEEHQDYNQVSPINNTCNVRSQVNVTPPDTFSFDPLDWPSWRKRFDRYISASGLVDRSEAQKIDMLLYCMGPKAEDIFSSFRIDNRLKMTYKTIIGKFENHFLPQRNLIYERAKFFKRTQQVGENTESFITSLYSLAETCNWGELNDELILLVLIIGMRNTKLSNRLQLDPELNLRKAIIAVRQSEELERQRVDLFEKDTTVEAIKRSNLLNEKHMLQKYHNNKYEKFTKKINKQSKQNKCNWCGKVAHEKKLCPAKNATCYLCNKVGHFSSVCRSKLIRQVNDSLPNESNLLIDNIDSVDKENSWTADIKFANAIVKFKIDTGADVTVVPANLSSKLAISLEPPLLSLYGPNKTPLKVSGTANVPLIYKDKYTVQKIYFAEEVTTPLLGRPAIEKLGLVSRIFEINKNTCPWKNEFNDIFEGLGKVSKPYTIELNEKVTPYAITTPRSVPLPLKNIVKKELQNMIAKGVITEVDKATDWCAPMVVVPKGSNQVRICVDLTRLNESVKRHYHPIPKLEQSLGQLAGAKIFTKLDANSGFWQIPLAPESQELTTFLSPFGRYKFMKLPFGITSAPEYFQRCMDELLQGQKNVIVHIDDILIWGANKAEHDMIVRQVLNKVRLAGMTLNKDKSQFGKREIKFLGHTISADGIKIDEDKVKAILEMKEPKNITDTQRFLGMINFLGKYIPQKAEVIEPINALLRKKNSWLWGEAQQKAFDRIKYLLTSPPCLAIYDPNRKTIISCDASSNGLGAVLLQQNEIGDRHPISYISRTLMPAEKNYANIEREALAITWACEKFKDFIIGKKIEIETDHKPLVQILKKKILDDLSPRLQRFRIKLMRFDYEILYKPGKDLPVPDTLSRTPIEVKEDRELILQQDETEAYIRKIVLSLPITDTNVKRIVEEQNSDEVCSMIKYFILNGWPERKTLPQSLNGYFEIRHELSIVDNILLRGSRLVIPKNLWNEMLTKLHKGHLGISKCRQRAQGAIWWPGLSTHLEDYIKRCPECIQNLNNRNEPLIPSSFPSRPWKEVGMDLFKINNKWYIVITDLYSRYFEVSELKSLRSNEIIQKCKSVFSRHGIPELVRTDNGPQFQKCPGAEFKLFAAEYGFQHVTSSPYFPQSNGAAEAAVKTAKTILKKNKEDPYIALLSYRNTPLANGFTPSELCMNRRLRDCVPTHPKLLEARPDFSRLKEKEDRYRKKYAENYDRRHRTKALAPLQPGDPVWVTDLKRHGTVISPCSNEERSYLIKTDKGVIRRNRIHLNLARYFRERRQERR